ncbi:MAG: GIY-YIG nuclease family protein [Acidimicrobiales bacterium]|nr:GIY-YIG nuclease family protein [Acidimicrobiales bacterium]
MIWIVRALLYALVGLTAVAILALGLMIGLVGVAVRAATGSAVLVERGAGLMRSIERLPRPRIGGPEAFVYLVQDERAATKIGISGDPGVRLATLQTGHPDSLHLIKTIGCRTTAEARCVEGDLHDFFQRYRMNGEWFDLSERQVRQAVRLAERWRSRPLSP